MKKFLNEWKASILGTLLLLFVAVIPNILTIGILGVIASRKNPVEIKRVKTPKLSDETCLECHNHMYCTPSMSRWFFNSVNDCPDRNRDLKSENEEFDKQWKSRKEKVNE